MEKFNSKTRKILSIGDIHHPKVDVERLCITRRNDGRDLIELESDIKSATVRLSKYLELDGDKYTRLVLEYEVGKTKYSVQKKTENLKEAEKISMYKDLKIVISKMWGCKTRIIPVIKGVLGTIKNELDIKLKLLPC